MNDQRANLVTLFGPNGSGKTRRLMEMEQRTTCDQVLRIGAETLIEDLVAEARHGLATDTLIRYRKIDNLLIDNTMGIGSKALRLKGRSRTGVGKNVGWQAHSTRFRHDL